MMMGVVGLVAVVVVVAALLHEPEPPMTSATVKNAPAFTSGIEEPKVEPYTPTLDEAMGRLADADRPFNVLILGDSTSLDTYKGWHVLTFQWLADQTDRPWTLWQWNSDQAVAEVRYHEQPRDRTGSGAMINVWNASAGGQGFTYAEANADRLIPDGEEFDLVIVNHGHNIAPERAYYTEGIPFLDSLHADRLSDAAMVMVAQNPERGDVLRIHKMSTIVDMVGVYAELHDLPVVDVYSAFNETGRPARLVDRVSMRHPTHAGYRLWFRETRDLLAPTLP